MDVIITRDEWTWLLHVTNGHDYNTSRMDMIMVTNGCDNTWRMDVIITRDEWMWLLHVSGHDYYTSRMDMIIARHEWTWL